MYSSHFLKWVKEKYPWAKWVATDVDGSVCIYKDEPRAHFMVWFKGGKSQEIAIFEYLSDVWYESKTKL